MTSPHKEIKRYRRFQGWDYSRGASLFITLVTEPRQPLFGAIVDGKMKLTPLGEEALRSLEALPFYNPGLSLFGRVVMPDHLHFNCHIVAGLDEPLKFLGNAVRRLKNHISKVIRDGRAGLDLTAKFGWRQGYHDHLLPNEQKIASTERYIAYNVAKWELMKNRPEALRIVEPLDSPRLDRADYWKGVGNVALLEEKNKIVSLRISRQVKGRQLEEVVKRMASINRANEQQTDAAYMEDLVEAAGKGAVGRFFFSLWAGVKKYIMDKLNILSMSVGTLIGGIIFLMAQVLLFVQMVLGGVYLTVLGIIGPVVFAMAILPGFKTGIRNWIARYVQISMWVPLCYLMMYINLKVSTIFCGMVTSGQAGLGGEWLMVALQAVSLASVAAVPKLAGMIVESTGDNGARSTISDPARSIARKLVNL